MKRRHAERDISTAKPGIPEDSRGTVATDRPLFEHMASGFLLCQVLYDQHRPLDYLCIEANPAFEAQTGLRRGDVLGKLATEILPGIESHPEGWLDVLAEVAASGRALRLVHYLPALHRWIEASVYRPRPRYVAFVINDVSELKRGEEEARREAERVREQNERLLRLASHDLRTPLSAILLQAQMLSQLPDPTGTLSRRAEMILASARRLDAIIDKMVGRSRPRHGKP